MSLHVSNLQFSLNYYSNVINKKSTIVSYQKNISCFIMANNEYHKSIYVVKCTNKLNKHIQNRHKDISFDNNL